MINLFFQPLDQFDIYIIKILYLFRKFYLINDYSSSDNLYYYESIFYNIIKVIFNNIIIYDIFLLLILYIIWNFFFNNINLIIKKFSQVFYEEFFYKFILNVLLSQIGRIGQFYYIFVSVLFFYILFANLIGLLSNSFTLTSHIMLTFLFGFSILLGLTLLSFMQHGLNFLLLFVPTGVPIFLLPLLVIIEIVSYIARGFSLSIRLFANLMSGHSLIHILLFFIIKILKFNYIIGFLGLQIILIIFILEIGISFLQAYVFAVLFLIYLKDSYIINH